MSKEDFEGRSLVPGSLVGVRRFNVDKLGRLTGLNYAQVWRPGVNDAKCKVGQGRSSAWTISYVLNTYGMSDTSPQAIEEAKPKEHRPGSLECNCGFYGFFSHDANNHGYGDGDVAGIIEGTGLATVGDKGFRVEKARVVALVRPQPQIPERRRIDTCARFLVRHTTLDKWLPYPAIPGVLASFISGIWFGVKGWWLLLPPLALVIALGVLLLWSSIRAIDLRYERTPEGSTAPWDLVTRNYPDVPIYPSMAAALREHPLSEEPAPIAPETAPDFWERKA